MATQTRFVVRVKAFQADRGMTQEAVAERARLSRVYLARWETG
jgi:transcriptional regulator with XRE-family HTH domain